MPPGCSPAPWGWSCYGKGQHFTHAQLEQLWTMAGGDPAVADVMAAIAEVETDGYAGSYNSTGATGLWQIEWPDSAPPGITKAALLDPATNAKAAVRLVGRDTSLGPGGTIYDNWVKWESPPGAYKAHLTGSNAAGGTPSSGGGSAALGGCVPALVLLPVLLVRRMLT